MISLTLNSKAQAGERFESELPYTCKSPVSEESELYLSFDLP